MLTTGEILAIEEGLKLLKDVMGKLSDLPDHPLVNGLGQNLLGVISIAEGYLSELK